MIIIEDIKIINFHFTKFYISISLSTSRKLRVREYYITSFHLLIYEITRLLVHLMVTNYSTALLTLHLSISQQLSL